MDVLNFDDHNILLNTQPYPLNSVRPRFPIVAGDNVAALYFPWWSNLALWSGDVTRIENGQTGLPFLGIADFKTFCNAHFYTDATAPALHFLGAWDASANTPTLTNGDPNPAGDFYITSVAGTVDFGAGPIAFAVNDLVVYNGSIWQNGGAATGMNLQQVTSVGNTTNTGIEFLDGSGNVLAFVTTPGGFSPTVAGTASADGSTGVSLITMPDNSLTEIAIFNAGGTVNIKADTLTGTRVQQHQDASGIIALEQTMTLQKATDAGNTTTNEIDYVDGSGNVLAVLGASYAGTVVIATQSADASTAVGLVTKPDNSINELAFVNAGGRLGLRADVLTAARIQQLQDQDGTIALTSDLISPVNAQTGTAYTTVLSDGGSLVTCDNASPVTVTIPANGSVAYPVGSRIDFAQLGAGKVSFAAAGGVTINSQSGYLSIFAQYVGVTIIKIAVNTWLLVGNLSV